MPKDDEHRPSILIADDDEQFLQVTAMVLRNAGFDVTAVSEGNHALLAMEVAGVAHKPYDLLLLDIRMPGATGWQVLKFARTQAAKGAYAPRALLMTGFTMELDLDRVRAEGADGILLKPIANSALVGEVKRVLAIPHGVPVRPAGSR